MSRVTSILVCYTNLDTDGRRVHVIERDLTEPDRIVGELLQPGGYLKLVELGLEDCVEEIDAQRVLGYALFKEGKNTKLSYPLEKFHSDVSGRSFHNGRFIQRMREKAATLSNVKLEQGTVTSLLEENKTIRGVQYKTKDGQEHTAYAPLTIVCDGCFSNLRRTLCNPKVDVPSCFVGLVLENCQLPFANHGHVILADPSPILFYPISSTEVRCLVDVPGQKLPSIANGQMAKYLKTTVAPQPVASTINTLAGALYMVFSASPDQARKEMRQACFDYLSLGGIFSRGPIALLSALNPHPLSLVLHFFAVAIYGVGRLLLPFPSPQRLWIGARLIWSAAGIIFPIIKAEGMRQMFFPATVPAYYKAPSVKSDI
ncbi:squalene epoxidase 1 [Quercus suber]|uniref:Squalene monooxygenase n=1 Tax=Quercus suber TaxID=58331 RepID=A0AAW0MEM8_QUESU